MIRQGEQNWLANAQITFLPLFLKLFLPSSFCYTEMGLFGWLIIMPWDDSPRLQCNDIS